MRESICNHMEKNRDFFGAFISEDGDDEYASFDDYLAAMRELGEWSVGHNYEQVLP